MDSILFHFRKKQCSENAETPQCGVSSLESSETSFIDCHLNLIPNSSYARHSSFVLSASPTALQRIAD